jgi:hypothetical protein
LILGISAAYRGAVTEKPREQDRHRLPRALFSVDGDKWKRFGTVAGTTKRSELLRAFIDWYLRVPGAKLPERPPRQDPPA